MDANIGAESFRKDQPLDRMSSEAKHEIDAQGFRVDQRSETEQHSQTKEVRELKDRTEIRMKDEKEVKLEEIKSKETVRSATEEEFRALLEAQMFSGVDEIQLSKETKTEEFSRQETKHDKFINNELKTEFSTHEDHKSSEVVEGPEWNKSKMKWLEGSSSQVEVDSDMPHLDEVVSVSAQAPLSFSATSDITLGKGPFGTFEAPQTNTKIFDVNINPNLEVSVSARNLAAESNKMELGGALTLEKEKLKKMQRLDAAMKESQVHGSLRGIHSDPGVHHEVKHKRHIIEEIIIEDSDKYYEHQEKKARTLPKIKRMKRPEIEIKEQDERRRSTGDVGELPAPIEQPAYPGSVQNINANQVTFMVEYEPPARARLQLPKGGVDWKAFGSLPENAKNIMGWSDGKGKKSPQEEVVVFDGEMHTDTMERKILPFGKKVGIHGESVTDVNESHEENRGLQFPSIHMPDIKFPSLKLSGRGHVKGPGETEGTPGETVTFVVQGDTPATDVKVRGDLPTAGVQGKASKQGEIFVDGDQEFEDHRSFQMPSIHMPDIKFPSMKLSGKAHPVNLDEKDAKGDESVTFVVKDNIPIADVKAHVESPQVNVKIKGVKQDEIVVGGDKHYEDSTSFHMPSLHMPEVKFPTLKVSGKGHIKENTRAEAQPESMTFVAEGDVPAGDAAFKGDFSGGSIKVPTGRQEELVVGGDNTFEDDRGFHMPDIKFPSLKLGGRGHAKTTGEHDVVDVETVTFVVKGNIPSPDVKFKGDVPAAELKVKANRQEEVIVNGERHYEDHGGFKMPSIHIPDIQFPSLKFSGKASSMEIPEKEIKGEESTTFIAKLPAANIKTQVDAPKVNVKVKGFRQDEIVVGGEKHYEDSSGFHMPSMHMPEVKFPTIKLSGKGNVKDNAGAEIQPESMTFVVKGDAPAGDVTLKGDISGGSIKIPAARQEELVVGGETTFQDDRGFHMPSVHMPDIKFPSLKLGGRGQVKTTGEPEVVDGETMTFVVKGDIPSTDVKVKGDIPTAALKNKGGRQGEVVVDGEQHYEDHGGFQLPSIHMPEIKFPSMKFSGKAHPTEGDDKEIKGSESAGFVVKSNIPSVDIKTDAGTPAANIKVKGGVQDEIVLGGDKHYEDNTSFHMPSMHMPDVKFPSLKLSGRGHAKESPGTTEQQQDLTFMVRGDIPPAGVKIKGEVPEGHLKLPSSKQQEHVVGGDQTFEDDSTFNMPSIHMPDIKFPSLKLAGRGHTKETAGAEEQPETITFVVKGDVPGGDIRVKADLPEGNIKVPSQKQDELVVGGETTFQDDRGFHMPSVNMPDIKFPSLKLGSRGHAKATAETDVTSGESATFTVKSDFHPPDVKFQGGIPTANLKVKGVKQKEIVLGGDKHYEDSTGFQMPSIHMPDVKFPTIKLSGRGHTKEDSGTEQHPVASTFVIKDDIPSADIKIKPDSPEGNINLPSGKQEEVVLGGENKFEDNRGFHMPSIHMPDIKFPSLKLSGRGQLKEVADADAAASETKTFVVKGDIPATDIKLKGDIPGANVKVDDSQPGQLNVGDDQIQGPVGIQMPSIHIQAPKVTMGKHQRQEEVVVNGEQVYNDDTHFSIPSVHMPEIKLPSFKPEGKIDAAGHMRDKQEEVVLDDTQLHTDKNTGGWLANVKLGGSRPSSTIEREDVRQSGGSLDQDDHSEVVTYVVTGDLPGSNIFVEKSEKPKGPKWIGFGRKKMAAELPDADAQVEFRGKRPRQQEEVVVGGNRLYTEDQGNPLLHFDAQLPSVHLGIGSKEHKWKLFGKKSGEYNMSPDFVNLPQVKLTATAERIEVPDVHVNVQAKPKVVLEIPQIQSKLMHQSPAQDTANIDMNLKASEEVNLGFENDINLDSNYIPQLNTNLQAESSEFTENIFAASTPKHGRQYPGLSGSFLSKDDSSIQKRQEVIKMERPVSTLMPDARLSDHGPRSLDISADSSGSHQYLSRMYSPGEFNFDGKLKHHSSKSQNVYASQDATIHSTSIPPLPHFVIIAIDFGTTFSGYAFSFARDTGSIHMMRKWEGGDPGVINQKTPTTLLLDPEGEFTAFGFTARDLYHDLSPKEAKRWMYFEKFKMALHHDADLSRDTEIKASNGQPFRALTIFTHALRFFKEHALAEVSEQSATRILNEDVRWVITVPAIWKAPAKQFMREAAYQAGIASPDNPEQLLIALEPEAASMYVRKQKLRQLIPEDIEERRSESPGDLSGEGPVLHDTIGYLTKSVDDEERSQLLSSNAMSMSFQQQSLPRFKSVRVDQDLNDTRYLVADCGGGTVDITVYEMAFGSGKLKELHRASGGPFGSIGVDQEFEKLLVDIFGADFIEAFKYKRPAGWVDFMLAFESRKRAANPFKSKPLNVSPPFSFMDYYKKYCNSTVEAAIRRYNNKDIRWSSQGMIRLMPDAMARLFEPTLSQVCQAIANVLNNTEGISYMFLVGGFSESLMLQQAVRLQFGHAVKILLPQDASLTILKGAVCFGLDPGVVTMRKSRMSYGVAVLNKFVRGKHPESKLVYKDNQEWCMEVFDPLVLVNQSVALGDSVIRRYVPAGSDQKLSIFNIYSSEKSDVSFITDKGVRKCGTLCLEFPEEDPQQPIRGRREVQARMTFGDTEIKVVALDVATGKSVRSTIDFMNN